MKNDLGRNTGHLAWLNQCDLGINFMWDVGERGKCKISDLGSEKDVVVSERIKGNMEVGVVREV